MTRSHSIYTASLWFWRALRRGEWLWLWLAVVIASSSVVLVEQLARSVHHSMLAKAAEALAADLVLSSSRPLPVDLRQQAQRRGLQVAESIELTSMLLANDQFQLIRLRGLDRPDPLRGQLRTEQGLGLADLAPDQLLADQQLQGLLDLERDSPLQLGNQTLRVGDWLTGSDPLFTSFSAFAPLALLPLERLKQLGLIGPGSRVTYALSFAGPAAAIAAWQRQLQQRLQPHWQLRSASAPNPDMERSLNTAWTFLDLSALATVLVAGLAILIASRYYLQRWIASMALMRAAGASDRQLRLLFASQLSWLALLGSLVGVLLGLALFQAITPWLADYFDPLIQPPPGRAALLGLASGSLALWTFSWPAFRQATQVSPLQVFRQMRPDYNPLSALLVSLVLLILLMVLLLSGGLVVWAAPSLLLAAAGFYLLALALLAALRRLQPLSRGWLRLALAALAREPGLVKLQLIALGLVIFLLILVSFVRQDLLNGWRDSLPPDTPNVFMINIQPDQRPAVRQLLAQQGLAPELVPVARGRLLAVNGKALEVGQQRTPRAKRLLQREANVALLDQVPEHNPVIAALPQARRRADLPPVSVEQGIAELFGLQLGDVLRFDFIGIQRDYQISALRQVEWQSFRLNFFFILHGEAAQSLPLSYMTNFHLGLSPQQTAPLRRQLQASAPGVVWIDVQDMIQRVQEVMDQAALAVTLLYLFTLASSFIVIFTATRAAQRGRLRSWLLLRTLGAAQGDIIRIGMTEFALIGLLAGLFAALLAQLASLLISQFWLELPARLNPQLWLASLGLSVALLLLIGWLTQRQPLRQTPKQLLQQLQADA
ncbi:ABC transporter permease [Magnetovirga frankeli]|uniref:ABC transporter permease n=1 Tax=Magnetovirga frankeli TaxID=947516 RepID=UPI003D34D1A9